MSERIRIVANHLKSEFPDGPEDNSLKAYEKNAAKLNLKVLSEEYLGPDHAMLIELRNKFCKSEAFNHNKLLFLDRQEKYNYILRQVIELASTPNINYATDLKNPISKIHVTQVANEFDISTGARYGIHLGLYVDTIQNLGSAKHDSLRDMGYSFKHYGCFALTELGHGSNVANIETTAVFNNATREFIFNSPTRTSTKWWIGAAGRTANMAIVWAQLIVGNDNKGVHAFVLEIRDYVTHETKPGVIIGDCGKKIELDGIDNGFIIFRDFKAGYDSLLDFYSQISEEGKYKTSIKNKEKRLGIMLGGLLRGRLIVVQSSELTLRNALTIALRYSALRKQFSLLDQPECSILDYQSQRCRLVPYLSKLFAIRSGQLYLYSSYTKVYPTVKTNHESEELAELHAILSGIKGTASSYAFSGIQECREACGGIGFSAHSGLGRLRNTVDILLTWEGDNNVLLQQTGKYILKQLQRKFKGAASESKTLPFLKVFETTFTWIIKTEQDITTENILSTFENRICYLSSEAIKRMQQNSGIYSSSLEVWNKSQVNYVSTLARVYIEYILIKEFQGLVKNIRNRCENTGKYMEKLCEVYAIDCLESNQRSYFEMGCSLEESIMIRDKHTRLCDEIGGEAVVIINGIASHDNFIGSVIGHSDGQAYSRLIQAVESEKNVYGRADWYKIIQSLRDLNP